MRRARCLYFIALVTSLAACGGEKSDTTEPPSAADPAPKPAVLTAANLGEQTVMSASEYLAEPPYNAADAGNGERLALLCRACHSLEQGGAHMIGPNLHGFFGSRIGARDDYDYSAAVREADFVWTPRALDAWMAEPGRFLPGNRMTFAGVGKAEDRADIIAYLLTVTAP